MIRIYGYGEYSLHFTEAFRERVKNRRRRRRRMVQTLAMPVAPSLSIISNPQFSNRVSFPILNTPKPKVK
jgi:hypothetical protein